MHDGYHFSPDGSAINPCKITNENFLTSPLIAGVLRFGEFTLKSGRTSPYFFNAGLFNTGHALARLGRYYAQAIIASGISFDMLFGPAYKGIPLVSAVAIALAEHHDRDLPYVSIAKRPRTMARVVISSVARFQAAY